jgi:hypothetical protein
MKPSCTVGHPLRHWMVAPAELLGQMFIETAMDRKYAGMRRQRICAEF